MTEAAAVFSALVRAAAGRYRRAGLLFGWRFAAGKLKGDPVYRAILERGLIPDSRRLLDLGCGQGLMAAWLLAAGARHAGGDWPDAWPDPPHVAEFAGIDLMPADIERARRALGNVAALRSNFTVGDVRTAPLGRADVAVILDVLHYMDYAAQDEVLRHVRDALAPSGMLLLRVGNAAAGWRFDFSQWVDRASLFLRGHRLDTLYCRTLAEWESSLEALGFAVDAQPMSQGTLFANVLLVARAVADQADTRTAAEVATSR